MQLQLTVMFTNKNEKWKNRLKKNGKYYGPIYTRFYGHFGREMQKCALKRFNNTNNL